MIWAVREFKEHLVLTLPWVGTSVTRSEPHPTWPWTGMGTTALQLLLNICGKVAREETGSIEQIQDPFTNISRREAAVVATFLQLCFVSLDTSERGLSLSWYYIRTYPDFSWYCLYSHKCTVVPPPILLNIRHPKSNCKCSNKCFAITDWWGGLIGFWDARILPSYQLHKSLQGACLPFIVVTSCCF